MKSQSISRILAAITVSVACGLLTACGGNPGASNDPDAPVRPPGAGPRQAGTDTQPIPAPGGEEIHGVGGGRGGGN